MERNVKQRCFLKLWLVAVLIAASGFAYAESTDKPEDPRQAIPENLEQPEAKPATSVTPAQAPAQAALQAPSTSTNHDSFMTTVQKTFPQLERALIILTAVNIVIVIFAALLYSVKRRMKQFSPVPLASMRQNRG